MVDFVLASNDVVCVVVAFATAIFDVTDVGLFNVDVGAGIEDEIDAVGVVDVWLELFFLAAAFNDSAVITLATTAFFGGEVFTTALALEDCVGEVREFRFIVAANRLSLIVGVQGFVSGERMTWNLHQ